jgi:peroxiredoxin
MSTTLTAPAKPQQDTISRTEIRAGDVLAERELTNIHSEPVQIPDPARTVHLQFRRYAGCPVCNLHLRSIAVRHDELVAAGIREVVVFHSSADTMLPHQGELPFAAIADPDKKLYADFGVEATMSPLAALKPRTWKAAGRALTQAPSLKGATGKGEQHMGLPADFLIAADGRVIAVKYGKRIDDHWSVDELLGLTRSDRQG